MTTPTISSNSQPTANDANNNSSTNASQSKATRRQKSEAQNSQEEEERDLPHFVFDPDSALVCYWTAAVAVVTLYNAWTIALRIAFPEMRVMNDQSYLPCIDILCDLIYFLDILMQLRTAYLQDGIPVFDPHKIRQHYVSQTYFIQDVICVLPSHTLLSLLPDGVEFCKYFLCSAGAARLTKLLKFHILYKFYNLAESLTSNPHLIRVLRLFLNLAIIIHWIACLYYLLSEYEGLGSNDWVYTNSTDQQRFSRKYLKCLYWSAMTLTTIGDTNTPETDLEYIFTGVIFLTGVFVFATVMGNVGDVISSMNANRQEFQARMDHIQMYLTHKKVPASLQLKIKKWAEYTWSRTKATDESRLLNMLPERLRAEVAVHVHLDSLKKVKIFEQCETGFLCELVLKLRSQVFSPGDYVCRVGETGREMFIINHGKVEVIVNNPATTKPMVVAVLSEGNYFGEISLLRLDGVQNRRTADVRSIGYSELLCLSRRDLMAALVEYPEAKSVLEDQAKKRMKTNLQAQRAFSVDTLLRSSQEQSSMDSGIMKDELIGHDVSEIKAMIEELKNANKVPGRSVWQMIAKCEVLQAKLSEKEKEVEDSKQRIRDLENLLYSRHFPKHKQDPEELLEEEPELQPIRTGNKVKKQYSQDEGRQSYYDSSFNEGDSRQVPDFKITPSSEVGSSSDESPTATNNNNFIRTSKITNIFEKPSSKHNKTCRRRIPQPTSSELLIEDSEDNLKIENVWNYHFFNETSIDHEILFDTQQISMTTSFRDEFHLGDALDLNVHTIPEESEEELGNNSHSSSENLLADARPLSFKNSALRSGKVASLPREELTNGLETLSSNENSNLKPVWNSELYQRRLSSTKDSDVSDREDGADDVVTTPDENRTHRSHPDAFPYTREQQATSESSSTHEIKRLLDGQASKSFKCVSGMDFLRMASMRSLQSDSNLNSRRSSWVCDSECDSEEDYASS